MASLEQASIFLFGEREENNRLDFVIMDIQIVAVSIPTSTIRPAYVSRSFNSI
jgi:hypothetical protein